MILFKVVLILVLIVVLGIELIFLKGKFVIKFMVLLIVVIDRLVIKLLWEVVVVLFYYFLFLRLILLVEILVDDFSEVIFNGFKLS